MRRSVPLLLLAPLLFAEMLSGETHEFKPRGYSIVFTANAEPALRIKPGDVVSTTCVDSNGDDETGKHVTEPYNSLTGPFYVEGAQPGDTLAVKLEKIWLTSRKGLASTRLSEASVTPQYLVRSQFKSKIYFWDYDLQSMTASTRGLGERMQKFKLPLRPFPGCIGVAPAWRESLSSIMADSHGGNLDYNKLVEGATVYLPVYVPGAFLFLGDGHAAQGDGEPSGGAVETTIGVRFRVALQSKKPIPSVRAESDEFYMAMGIGNPLDVSFQRATANMVDWLTKDFGLTNEEAHVLIGTTARYDIAAVVNPRGAGVVCKIAKKTLGKLTGGR